MITLVRETKLLPSFFFWCNILPSNSVSSSFSYVGTVAAGQGEAVSSYVAVEFSSIQSFSSMFVLASLSLSLSLSFWFFGWGVDR